MSLRITDFIDLKFSDIPSSYSYHERNITEPKRRDDFVLPVNKTERESHWLQFDMHVEQSR